MNDNHDEPVLDESHTPPSGRPEKKEHPITEIIRFSLIALLIVIPIRTFIAQPFIVSGASMQETFQNGEYLIVDQLSYQFESPERGDVIVFHYPVDTTKFFIKRVVGVPGDTISIEGNVVHITNSEHPHGATLDEPYIASMKPNTYLEETLGDGEYFVMGDNRDQSSDSRVWGVLQERHIVGQAFIRLFPIGAAAVYPGEFDSDEALTDD